MSLKVLAALLEESENQIAHGDVCIHRVSEVMDRRLDAGYDTRESEELLIALREAQASRFVRHSQLLADLELERAASH